MRDQARGNPLHFVHDGKIICATQRAGSTSIIESMPRFKRVGKRWCYLHRDTMRSIMWIREPWDRLASAAKVYQAKDYEKWIKSVLTPTNQNCHVLPQTQIHSFEERPLWNVVYPFETFAESWAKEFPTTSLGWKRHSPTRTQASEMKAQLTSDTIQLVNDYYKDDIELYEHTRRLVI